MFGPPPVDPTLLVKLLIEGVAQRIADQPSTSRENTAYTLAVKETLKEIARKHSPSSTCIYTHSEPEMQEFLLDLVWWDKDLTEGASLVCECEWFYDRFSNEQRYAENVGTDFGKLLVFKAPLKLMIFASVDGAPDMQQLVLNEIDRYLRGYKHHLAGETYVILDFAPKLAAWSASVEKSGQGGLQLVPMSL